MKSLPIFAGLPSMLATLASVSAIPQGGKPIEPSLPLSFTTIGGPGPVVPPTTTATDTVITTINPGGPEQTTSTTITETATVTLSQSTPPASQSNPSTPPPDTTIGVSPSQTPGGHGHRKTHTSSLLIYLTAGALLYSVVA